MPLLSQSNLAATSVTPNYESNIYTDLSGPGVARIIAGAD
jgi:hypothetical protein